LYKYRGISQTLTEKCLKSPSMGEEEAILRVNYERGMLNEE
jgi:hypothetical protein